MDEQTLRAWVRGTLSPARRREVTIWMLRCREPHLPFLMEALTREYEDEKADARLVERVPGAQTLVDAWRWLIDAGRGAWTTGEQSSALAVLSMTDEGVTDGFELTARPDGVLHVDVRLASAADVVVFVTDDSEAEPTLLLSERFAAGTWPNVAAWQPEPNDGRTTFWLFAGLSPPPAALEPCLATARAGRVKAWARRWEPGG